MIDQIQKVLVRDLDALLNELKAYPTEEMIWTVPPGISNSAGTLALHLVGNLQHFIGAVLGRSGYVRDRTAEFSDRDVPLSLIEHRIAVTKQAVSNALAGLDENVLDAQYPIAIGDHHPTTRLFLTHLVSHTAYHLGQIDYHRRLITGSNTPAGPSIARLNRAT